MLRPKLLTTLQAYTHPQIVADVTDRALIEARLAALPRDVQVYAINGPFFFGAAERFKDALGEVGRTPRVLILRLGNVPVIDSTGLHALGDVLRRSQRDGTRVLLAEVQPQVQRVIERSAVGELVREVFCESLDDAIRRSTEPRA